MVWFERNKAGVNTLLVTSLVMPFSLTRKKYNIIYYVIILILPFMDGSRDLDYRWGPRF